MNITKKREQNIFKRHGFRRPENDWRIQILRAAVFGGVLLVLTVLGSWDHSQIRIFEGLEETSSIPEKVTGITCAEGRNTTVMECARLNYLQINRTKEDNVFGIN